MAFEQVALSHLKAIPFLAGVPDKLLTGLLEDSRLVAIPAGECAVRQGEFGDTFYLILHGEMGVEVWSDDGTAVEVARLRTGQFFGELAMIGKGHRSATVRAVGDGVELLEVAKGPFDKLLKQKSVAEAMEQLYSRRTLEAFIRENEYLRDVSDVDKKLLTDTGKILRLHATEDVFKAGDPPQSFYFVRQGFLKIWRQDGEAESVLAYLRDKDFFGDLELVTGQPRVATVTAMEPVELVVLPRSVFAGLYQRYPELIKRFRKYELDRRAEAESKSQSKTGILFIKDLVEMGMAQARSALIIDMDLCSRCGNCVQSCEDLHGHSRLIRRGKKLTRREQETKKLENLFFPNSCIHCRTPECMSGCPTGSIARDKEGEVYIKDFCIGCGACAKGCEFGNISIVSLGDKKTAKPERKAVKCDICKGYDSPNCVYNCPQAAILRIDPNAYFEELHSEHIDLVSLAASA